MEQILKVKNGKYNIEKIIKAGDSNIKKRTNNQDIIYNAIESINTPAKKITFIDDDVRLYFGSGKYLTLKNYKKYSSYELYELALSYVDENTKVIRVNRISTKFKKALITGAMAVSLISVANNLISNAQDTSTSIETTTEDENDLDELLQETTTAPIEIETENITAEVETPTTNIETTTSTPIEDNTQSVVTIDGKTFDERLEETAMMVSGENNFSGIALSTKFSEYYCSRIAQYANSNIWEYMEKYGTQFGVDPYILLSIGYAETNLEHNDTIPGGSEYNGHAVGIGQHENPTGKESVTAFNYETQEYETEVISMANACDLEMNIKMTAMRLQNKLSKYNYNIYAVIQSYNYGDGAMSIILSRYAEQKNCSVDDVLSNYKDLGWLDIVEDFHLNPQNYLSNWSYNTYGNGEYIKDVLGYYIGTESINKLPDGSEVLTNMVTLENTYGQKSVDIHKY